MSQPEAFGGVEAGGTKFRCLIANEPGEILADATIPTTSPRETLDRVSAFFAEQRSRSTLLGVGVASFGPIDLRRQSPTYGHILNTPKPSWAHFDLVGAVAAATGDPSPAFDTDVNAAALAEYVWGAQPDVDPLVYLTVGTGIGGGAIVNGHLLHGRVHPEMGHIRVAMDPAGEPIAGSCPMHGNCLEGLASGRAIRERYGAEARELPDAHPAWPLVTDYVASGVANIILTLSPERIVIGGGVSQRLLWPRLYQRLEDLLNDYPVKTPSWAQYVMPPRLREDSGALGAIALARYLRGGQRAAVPTVSRPAISAVWARQT
jgi:fructokinase